MLALENSDEDRLHLALIVGRRWKWKEQEGPVRSTSSSAFPRNAAPKC